MQEAKIGIVEDEIIIADSIRSVLKSMQYVVPEPSCDYKEAVMMLHTEQPDLALLDINLAGNEQDGIAVARYIRDNMDIPIIFLTANSDAGTLARAKTVSPNAFLVKPFQAEELNAAIEIALHNFYAPVNKSRDSKARQYIFIKDGSQFHKVGFDEILYLESDHVYVSVHTTQRKFLVRTSMQQYQDELDSNIFARIHRGYIVNRNKIDSIAATSVTIGNTTLPVSKRYKDDLLSQL